MTYQSGKTLKTSGGVSLSVWLPALTLALGPLLLLLVVMPRSTGLALSYALGAGCALVALHLIRTRRELAGNPLHRDSSGSDDSECGAALRRDQTPSELTRDSLISLLDSELKPDLPPTLLGLIRIGNYDRMAAFDLAIADQFLTAFHDRLQAALGKTRCLVRIERNCFAVWFRDERDIGAAQAELDVLGYALTHQISSDAYVIEPEIEIGSVTSSQPPETPQELISRAASALTRQSGSGQVSPSVAKTTKPDKERRFSIEQDIRHAISRGELELQYQPFIDTAEMRISGAEALLRWHHPKWGAISPVEFVPILEATGHMQEVGRWVLNTACRQLREWRELGRSDFRMAINLSASQLQDGDLKTAIERTVQNHGLSPSSIELELTETAAMEDSALTLRLFRSLRDAGYSLSIDDFGSGYSSMSYLKNLPFSKLKIDREFVSHVDESRESGAICRALVELASGLGITVLAEGVERREEVEALVAMGCTRFQGFYFSKPMKAEAFADKISNADWLMPLCSPAVRLQGDLKRRYS